MKIFGREPAMWAMLLSGSIALFSAFLVDLSIQQQGVLNTVVQAVLGLVVAIAVAQEKLVPALTGLLTALIAAGAAFGFNLSPEQQGALMVFVTSVAAFWIRDRVVAPVNLVGDRVQTVPLS